MPSPHARRWVALLLGLSLVSCSAPATQPVDPMVALIAAAKAEGKLTVMPLPPNWCNYGGIIEAFEAKYGIDVTVRDPDAGSADAVAALSEGGADTPDAVEVGYAYSQQLTNEKLVVPYKVSTWESIPANLKEPSGHWTSGYYGVMAFEVNTALVKNVPQDWPDLLKPEYAGQVALAGDPTVSSQAMMSVYAANLANGGNFNNVAPGLNFFRTLYEQGNFLPVIARSAHIAAGRMPITIRWDYNGLNDQIVFAGAPPIEVVIPKSLVVGGSYIHALSPNAHHPNAAKLWLEFLFSDEGQLMWLAAGCRPVRFKDLQARNVIPEALLANLPDEAAYAAAIFPSTDQINSAKTLIAEGWLPTVGVAVEEAQP